MAEDHDIGARTGKRSAKRPPPKPSSPDERPADPPPASIPPVTKKIGESRDQLAKRAEWFKNRHGQDKS